MPNAEQAVETLRDKLKNGERDIDDEADRQVLLDFSDEMKLMRETYGHHRHVKLLRHCVRMAEHAPARLVDALEDKAAAEEIVRWIHSEYDLDETPETNQNYRVALRVFGRRVDDEHGKNPPPSIDWVKSTLPRDYDPAPDPADMLRWEDDVEPMLEECRNKRDAAAIALQFDAGLRGGELYDLRVGDLTDTNHGKSVSVDGKTGQRSVDLIPSVTPINRWLEDHPGGPDDYIWSALNSADRLSYNSYLDMFKRPASRAGVDKDVTPTNFRKSNLAWLCRQGMNARYIEQRQGRNHGSDAVARYAAIFDDDVGDEYARLMGLDVEEDDDTTDFRPVPCPHCGQKTPEREEFCQHCSRALNHEVVQLVGEISEHLDNRLIQADEPKTREKLVRARRSVQERPERMGADELHELASSLSPSSSED